MPNYQGEGSFRGVITGYHIYEAKTGSVGVTLNVRIQEAWNPETEQWDDWTEFEETTTYGTIWVIGPKGLNQKGVDSLVEHAGWDGDLDSIYSMSWSPSPIHFTIAQSTYEGKSEYKLNFLNAYDSIPGGGGNVNADRVRELKAQFGAQLRAVVGSKKMNAKPAAAATPAPSAPPARKAPSLPTAAAPAAVEQEGPPSGETPF